MLQELLDITRGFVNRVSCLAKEEHRNLLNVDTVYKLHRQRTKLTQYDMNKLCKTPAEDSQNSPTALGIQTKRQTRHQAINMAEIARSNRVTPVQNSSLGC